MKRFATILIMLFVAMNLLHAQEEKLSDMPEAQRNATLTAIAKATFQREMPDVYREYGTPTIEQGIITYSPASYDASFYGEQYGDVYYVVTFPRNPQTETSIFIAGYACKVHIWNDTQEAFYFEFGDSELEMGKLLCKRDKRETK